MKSPLATALGRALEQTRASNPAEATRIIQAALAGRHIPAADETDQGEGPPAHSGSADLLTIGDHRARQPAAEPPRPAEGPRPPRRSLRDVVDALSRTRRRLAPEDLTGRRGSPAIPAGATYETRTFTSAAGGRDYRLYVPSALPDGPQGLVLMLHGCTQDADDFACGTQMNELAERHGLIVAYPIQTRGDNVQACWNWFRPSDQAAGRGEPGILAGLAVALREEFGVCRTRVFAAGLSAGGAMAAILGASHPEVFSAIGVHSGLPHGSAHDVVSAFAAMRGEGGVSAPAGAGRVRTIVFHGSADATVHPSNADSILRAATARSAVETARIAGRSSRGRSFERTIATGPGGAVVAELWVVEGAGHAWSGGAVSGSYTDPTGPDASAEMVRFFLTPAQDGRGDV